MSTNAGIRRNWEIRTNSSFVRNLCDQGLTQLFMSTAGAQRLHVEPPEVTAVSGQSMTFACFATQRPVTLTWVKDAVYALAIDRFIVSPEQSRISVGVNETTGAYELHIKNLQVRGLKYCLSVLFVCLFACNFCFVLSNDVFLICFNVLYWFS